MILVFVNVANFVFQISLFDTNGTLHVWYGTGSNPEDFDS